MGSAYPTDKVYTTLTDVKLVSTNNPSNVSKPSYDYQPLNAMAMLEEEWNGGFVDVTGLGRAVVTIESAQLMTPSLLQKFVEKKASEEIHGFRYDCKSRYKDKEGAITMLDWYQRGNNIISFINHKKAVSSERKASKAYKRAFAANCVKEQLKVCITNVHAPFLLKLHDQRFKEVSLKQLLQGFRVPPGSTESKLQACFRRILQLVCVVPEDIKKFTVRDSRGSTALTDLPLELTSLLEELGLALLGLSRPELQESYDDSLLSQSGYFLGLGTNDDERSAVLRANREMRDMWTVGAHDCLKYAITDLRSYSVTWSRDCEGHEIPHWENSKRRKIEVTPAAAGD